jgi:membrane-associated protease RseP (regulator of RpoE activity)
MTALAYTVGVLVFAFGVAFSIALHEMGHLIPGKLFNVKVTQYFVGFGKTLWSRQRGETEYGVKAIPLGGYCKLVGMVPPNADDPRGDEDLVRSRRTGMFAQLVSDAKAAEYEEVAPEDHDRLFYNKPWWQRVVIMGSGVAINLVLAFVFFAIAFIGIGIQSATTTVASVSQCVIAVSQTDLGAADRPCRSSDPESPAKAAGFLPGDEIVSFNGTSIKDWSQVQDAIRANGDDQATVVVQRGGKRLTLKPTTVVSTVAELDDSTKVTKAGFLGVVPTTAKQRQDVGYVVSTMGTGTWQTIQTIGQLPNKLYHVARASVGLEKRDINGPISIVGAGRVAGEVASEHAVSLSDRTFQILALLAGLNLFLGLVNLVPLPPFDGGGIATTLYETVRRTFARLRGRPDPGGVDSAKLLPVTYVMATLILVMSIILIYADIVAPVSLT